MEASTRSLQFSFIKRVKHRNFSFTNYVGKGTTSPAIESNRKKNLSFAKTKYNPPDPIQRNDQPELIPIADIIEVDPIRPRVLKQTSITNFFKR